MLVGAVLAFSAAMTAFFGLRHAPAVNPAQEPPVEPHRGVAGRRALARG